MVIRPLLVHRRAPFERGFFLKCREPPAATSRRRVGRLCMAEANSPGTPDGAKLQGVNRRVLRTSQGEAEGGDCLYVLFTVWSERRRVNQRSDVNKTRELRRALEEPVAACHSVDARRHEDRLWITQQFKVGILHLPVRHLHPHPRRLQPLF